MHNKDVCSPSSKGGFGIGVNAGGGMQLNAGAFASSSALTNETLPSLAGNSSNDGGSLYPDSVSGTEITSPNKMHNKDVCSPSSKGGFGIGVKTGGGMQLNAGAFAKSCSALTSGSLPSLAGNCSNDGSDSLYPDSVSGTEYHPRVLQKHPDNSDEVEAPQKENGELRTVKKDLEKNKIEQSTNSPIKIGVDANTAGQMQSDAGVYIPDYQHSRSDLITWLGLDSDSLAAAMYRYGLPNEVEPPQQEKGQFHNPMQINEIPNPMQINEIGQSLSPMDLLESKKADFGSNWTEVYNLQLPGMGKLRYETVRQQKGLETVEVYDKLPTIQEGIEKVQHKGLEKEGFETETLPTVEGSEKQKVSELPQQKELMNDYIVPAIKEMEKNITEKIRDFIREELTEKIRDFIREELGSQEYKEFISVCFAEAIKGGEEK